MHKVFVATGDMEYAAELLQVRGGEWSVAVATDAVAAKALLDTAGMTVALFDRRSEWVNEDLLRLASSVSPGTLRVALVPDLAVAAAVRNARLAHQILAAQTAPAIVADVCDRAVAVHELTKNPELLAIVGSGGDIPAPPKMWRKLTEVLEDSSSTTSDIAEVVGADPAIAAQMVRFANSAFFGLSRRITDLREAVGLLGVTTIRALVLDAEASRAFPNTVPGLPRRRLQTHAMATARIAKETAGKTSSADAYTAGLLIDIGLLLLASIRPADTKSCLEEQRARKVPLSLIERERYGFSHDEVGACLLGLWGLPVTVMDAVAHHHEKPGFNGLLSVREAVFIARDAAQRYGAKDPLDPEAHLIPDDEIAKDKTLELMALSAHSVAAEEHGAI